MLHSTEHVPRTLLYPGLKQLGSVDAKTVRGIKSASTAYPAGGGHVGIDGQGLAAAEEQVVHCGQLAVKPDVHIDDGDPLQPLQLAEVRPGLPLLGDDSLHHINCNLDLTHV